MGSGSEGEETDDFAKSVMTPNRLVADMTQQYFATAASGFGDDNRWFQQGTKFVNPTELWAQPLSSIPCSSSIARFAPVAYGPSGSSSTAFSNSILAAAGLSINSEPFR